MATNPTYLVAYIGLKVAAAYTAQSVFEDDTRHVVSAGFGGCRSTSWPRTGSGSGWISHARVEL